MTASHIMRGGWLSLTATPTFAVMALLAAVHDGGMPDMMCSGGGSPLSGMVTMYALMSAFHLGPWLRLLHRRYPATPAHAHNG